jgi:arabinofuranan 3-O-arabinosyltransferase
VTATSADEPTHASPLARFGGWITVVVPTLLTFVPLLLTASGVVGADTKTYLYLDPGKVLAEAPWVWNSQIGMGSVTHQYIGYLWPMGPFYWLFDALGVPDWVAQRIWIGGIILAAGLGVRYLCRTLSWARDQWGAVLVAMLAYMFSPYLLNYSARISVILLPWAALPWLIALTARSIRHGGWRHPALFALVMLTVGGINATAVILVALGPLLYVVHAVWIDREATLRQSLAAIGRMGLLTLVTSLWWLAGLWAEGRYGLPVIRYTETYRTVATVSSAPEVLRGLGYWFFYGSDKLGPWTQPSSTYTTNVAVLTLSYAIPVAAIVAAAVVRWRYRALFLTIVVVGALTAVAAHPWTNPSLVGAVFKAFTRSDAGLSLRSTPRAVPLVSLGLALFLGGAVSALARRIPRLALPVTALAALVLYANLPTLWTGQMVGENLQRPEDIPQYWIDAAAYLQAKNTDTRVIEVPGADFASYRWGNTVDPITPGLMTRGYAARELFQYGSPQSAALLDALDHRIQEGTINPDAIAPISRVLGAGDLVDRSDLQYERYRTPRPRDLYDVLLATPGLGPILRFGEPVANVAGPEQPLIDETELGGDPTRPNPAPVTAFNVQQQVPIVRTHTATGTLLMAGDAEGLVDAAGVGLVDARQGSFFSASYAADPDGFDTIYGDDADLLVTDTNRRRAERWGTIREQFGYTERADETAPYDPTDQRLEVFPDQTQANQTVSEQRGGVVVTATAYGNPITYTPDDRPANALDGDPNSSWRVGAIDDPRGERLIVDIDHDVTTDHLQLLQPIRLFRNRFITRARLHFDDHPPIDIDLTDASRSEPGQTVTFPTTTFHHLEIEILDTNVAPRPRYDGFSGVGFAEVGIEGVRVDEVIRPPTDLLDRAGASSLGHRLAFVFTRLRSNPAEPVRLDEEPGMNRLLQLPTARGFGLLGGARLSDYVPDATIDRLVGIPGADGGGITVTSSAHLPGALHQRGSAALDGDPTTFWSGPFQAATGQWLHVDLGAPTTLDHLDLQLVADGRHSVPTEITIEPDGDPSRAVVVAVPPVADGEQPNAVVAAPVDFAPVTGSTFTVTVTGARTQLERDWYSNGFSAAPVAIAELGIPGRTVAAPAATFDSGCRADLVTVDGQPVPVRVTGTSDDALDRQPLTVALCDQTSIQVSAGEHVLRTAVGRDLGIDIDQLSLTSDKGGGPTTLDPTAVAEGQGGPSTTGGGGEGPPVTTVHEGRVSYDLRVEAADRPFWLAVGQSWSDGWAASIDGQTLPPPQVIDGYGNGWLIDPAVYGTGPIDIHVEWMPQRIVWICIWLSVAGVLACLVLAVVRPGRRPGLPARTGPDHPIDPVLGLGLRRPGLAAGWPVAIGATAGLALFVALTTPLHGAGIPALVAIVGGLTVLSFRWRRGRGLLALASAASLGLAALYTIVSQFRHHHDADFLWPEQFSRVNLFGLAAIFLLLAEATRDLLVHRRDIVGPDGPDGPDGIVGSGEPPD